MTAVDMILQLRPDPTLPVTAASLEHEIRSIWPDLAAVFAQLMGSKALHGGVMANRADHLVTCAQDWLPYGFEGTAPQAGGQNLADTFSDLCTFVAMAPPLRELRGVGMPWETAKVIALAGLRARLDHLAGHEYPSSVDLLEDFVGGNEAFSLYEIALLADMNEKSVRNATQAGKPDRLVTTRSGKHSVVLPEAAYTWLKNRRKFVETKHTRGTGNEK